MAVTMMVGSCASAYSQSAKPAQSLSRSSPNAVPSTASETYGPDDVGGDEFAEDGSGGEEPVEPNWPVVALGEGQEYEGGRMTVKEVTCGLSSLRKAATNAAWQGED